MFEKRSEWRKCALKRAYMSPKAVLVEYSYDINVVASSLRCTISTFRVGDPDPITGLHCNSVRITDPIPTTFSMRSTHPCDQYVIEGVKYAD